MLATHGDDRVGPSLECFDVVLRHIVPGGMREAVHESRTIRLCTANWAVATVFISYVEAKETRKLSSLA